MIEDKQDKTKEEIEKAPQVSWNLAEAIVQEIAGLLLRSSTAYTESTLDGFDRSMNSLRSVRMRIVADLSEKEKKNMVDKEKRYFLNSGVARISRLAKLTPNQAKAYYTAYIVLGEYNELVMKALKKYGYLIPIKKKKIKLA